MSREKREFKLKKEHIKLISRMCIDYDEDTEFGAPRVNPKRPYGNSDVYNDIAEILGIKPEGEEYDGQRGFSNEQLDYMLTLHKETRDAMQIVLTCKTFKPGTYQTEDFGYTWKKL